jgi:hypothetical protein
VNQSFSRHVIITLFDLKIKDDKTLLFTFKKEAKNKISNIEHYYIYAWKKKNFENFEMLLHFLKKSTVNESRFLNADNRAHNCQNDDSETIKKKKNTFSKT